MINRLKEAREEISMTQEELAEKSGISRVTISGIESGRMAVAKSDTLAKIADAIGKKVTDIFF